MPTNFPLCDLHTHTTASDGWSVPAQLLELAPPNLQVLCVTDHDTLAGYEFGAKQETPIKVLGGIEISTEERVDVLGLGLHRKTHDLLSYTAAEDVIFLARKAKLREVLNARFSIDFDLPSRKVTRSAIREILLLNWDGAKSESREKLREIATNAFVEIRELTEGQRRPPISLATQWIREAGGLAVLAHPIRRFLNVAGVTEFLRSHGRYRQFDAIEIRHPSASIDQESELREIAHDLGLLTSGGSDYHFPRRQSLGVAQSSLSCLPQLMEAPSVTLAATLC